MRLTSIQGVIRRRLLVNFRVDPEVMQRQLPAGFEPKLHAGFGVAGICLIRLEQIRPSFVALPFGLSSENAAHRVAVLRTATSVPVSEGVYIPQRHTNSWLVLSVGGRFFPGQHQRARFDVDDDLLEVRLVMRSDDGSTQVRVHGKEVGSLSSSSVFPSIEAASNFFKGGAIGYSATRDPKRLEALKLETRSWSVAPLDVDEVYSSWFSDRDRFPNGSVQFDCALVMRNIRHRWHAEGDLYAEDMQRATQVANTLGQA